MTEAVSATSTGNLAEFGEDFQKKIFQAMMFDKQFAEQMSEVFNVQYFDQKYLQFLAGKYVEYYTKYKDFPTLKIVLEIIRENLSHDKDIPLREQVIKYLKEVRKNPNPGDLPYVKEKSLEFCRKQSLRIALMNAVDSLESGKQERYESIVTEIRKAVSVGTTPSLGHDFFKDIDSRFIAIKRSCIPTGMDQLDAILNGGLGAGELACIVAGTGVGKSHLMVQLGAVAMLHGKNVMHYTFELSESNVGIRYDSHFCHIDSNEIIANKSSVIDYYAANSQNMGSLRIKEFPANTATINTIRSHLERLSLTGFVPDLITFDYADLMRSSRQYDSPRHELKLLYEELRALAVEKKVACITASQSNKEGINSDIIDVTNLNESLGKAFTCDIILSISRKSLEKASGWGRLFVAKNRAGRDGICFNIKIDPAQSRFEIIGETESTAEQKNETAGKKALLAHWKSLQGSKEYKLESVVEI